jgi:hypothetical protein
MEDLVLNTILIFNLQMTNKFVSTNYKSKGFGMQRSEDDLSWVSTILAKVFAHLLGIFAQPLGLLAYSTKKLIQSINLLSQLTNELT